jgi:hypothetical protein
MVIFDNVLDRDDADVHNEFVAYYQIIVTVYVSVSCDPTRNIQRL